MTIFVAFFSSTKLQLGCVMPSATITANFMQFNIKSTHNFQYPMQLFIIFIYELYCEPSKGGSTMEPPYIRQCFARHEYNLGKLGHH